MCFVDNFTPLPLLAQYFRFRFQGQLTTTSGQRMALWALWSPANALSFLNTLSPRSGCSCQTKRKKRERVWTNTDVARGGWVECAGPGPLCWKDCVVSAGSGLAGSFPCRHQHSGALWHSRGPPSHIPLNHQHDLRVFLLFKLLAAHTTGTNCCSSLSLSFICTSCFGFCMANALEQKSLS